MLETKRLLSVSGSNTRTAESSNITCEKKMIPTCLLNVLRILGLFPPKILPTTKKHSGRIRRCIQAIYWTICAAFMLLNVVGSVYIIVDELEKDERNAILTAFVEALVCIETNRGAIICLITYLSCRNGLENIFERVKELDILFPLNSPNLSAQKLNRCLLALLAFVFLIDICMDIQTFIAWQTMFDRDGIPFLPFLIIPTNVIVAMNVCLITPVKLLARIVVVIISSSGIVLLRCLKGISDTLVNDSNKNLKMLKKQYFVLVDALEVINKELGSLLALTLFSDLVPVCGRVAKLLFALTDGYEPNVTWKVIRNLYYVVIGVGFYGIGMYLPFGLLHKEMSNLKWFVLKLERQMVITNSVTADNTTNDLISCRTMLEEQPLVLKFPLGLHIHENFPLMVVTVLSSYTLILWQTMKDKFGNAEERFGNYTAHQS